MMALSTFHIGLNEAARRPVCDTALADMELPEPAPNIVKRRVDWMDLTLTTESPFNFGVSDARRHCEP
jgi:hypothetical protein